MCGNCGPTPPEVKEAFEEFEVALAKFLEATGPTSDIITDWVLITAQTELHEHVDSTRTRWDTPINQQLYRTKGLLHETIDNITADDMAHFFAHRFGSDD